MAVGEGELVGRQAVVDPVARCTGADGATSVVSSCDVYEFTGGSLTTVTSYAVELEPAPGATG